jgi:serine/threonine protein kinase
MIDVIHLEDATVITCELAEGGSLLDYIRGYGKPGLPEITCQRMFHQLFSAVTYLHTEAGLLHRDIKLENILLDRHGNIKLADFGLSQDNIMLVQHPIEPPGSQLTRNRSTSMIEPHPRNCIGLCCSSLDQVIHVPNSAYHVSLPRRQKTKHVVGSLHYCPPELLQVAPERRALDPVYSSKTDIYSMGCCLYAMLTGALPFSDSFVPRLQLSIMNGRFDHARLDETPAAKEVVMGMIAPIEERWTLERIKMHPWVRGGE